ncbi:MAG: FGGY-family carbohydrate kinase [Planctomycetota bacterium]|jgi:FGGY-family pentulose kinase
MYALGIDVGTGSARAGIFDEHGTQIASAAHPITTWRPHTDHVEQSSEDIWAACGSAVRAAMDEAGAVPDDVVGIGFDATCSLVAVDERGRPVTVSTTGSAEQNVIVWMDHRAHEQTERINARGHDVLRYVGGRLSPEMQSPKLLWLSENLSRTWARARLFLDLPDYLTYRATGSTTRSLCTTVCKWTYLGHEGRWSDDYWRSIGLAHLVDGGGDRIGNVVRPMGEPLAAGLTAGAAGDLGLNPGTAVGVAIIDAHAGGIGMLGARFDGAAPGAAAMNRRLALIGGTSSCHMAVAPEPRFIDGVWGPYFGAMLPELWLTEGGQSATGALIDHVIESHARHADLLQDARESGRTVYELLGARLEQLAAGGDSAVLTRDLHVMPDFHGNRSPRGDATLRGMISGLRLENTLDELALLYLATIQAIAHGTRHIVSALNDGGFAIDTLFACGGGTKNPLFLREHADVTGCRIVLPKEPEAVLLGAAILGAVAGGVHPSVAEAMAAMSHAGAVIEPREQIAAFHDAKHAVFHRLYDDQVAYRDTMNG